MSRDDIFKNKNTLDKDFTFDSKVAEVFDDMLSRSVPCYQQVIAMTAAILKKFLHPQDLICDLGCSTGTTIISLARILAELRPVFIGFDNSRAMIDKALIKAEMYGKKQNVSFLQQDILKFSRSDTGAIILNYTMQFIRPLDRPKFAARLYQSLRPGGVLIMSEKVISTNPTINRCYIDFYLDFKRDQGYSEIEITRKREALENVLVPFSCRENITMLEQAGFTDVEPFFQWFNFISFIAIK